mmetsp:Transcript_67645/g.141023  ORF Transcript_67645/g.141023 Transcript_67645/m.141023 type:complete len:93 (-) Transcript_67645:88-366(-)
MPPFPRDVTEATEMVDAAEAVVGAVVVTEMEGAAEDVEEVLVVAPLLHALLGSTVRTSPPSKRQAVLHLGATLEWSLLHVHREFLFLWYSAV